MCPGHHYSYILFSSFSPLSRSNNACSYEQVDNTHGSPHPFLQGVLALPPVFAWIKEQTLGVLNNKVMAQGLRPVPRHRILVGVAILRASCLYRIAASPQGDIGPEEDMVRTGL
jgi:hypothetical protein